MNREEIKKAVAATVVSLAKEEAEEAIKAIDLEDASRTCAADEERRAVFLASHGHVHGVPRHSYRRVAHEAVKAQTRNVQNILTPQFDRTSAL